MKFAGLETALVNAFLDKQRADLAKGYRLEVNHLEAERLAVLVMDTIQIWDSKDCAEHRWSYSSPIKCLVCGAEPAPPHSDDLIEVEGDINEEFYVLSLADDPLVDVRTPLFRLCEVWEHLRKEHTDEVADINPTHWSHGRIHDFHDALHASDDQKGTES